MLKIQFLLKFRPSPYTYGGYSGDAYQDNLQYSEGGYSDGEYYSGGVYSEGGYSSGLSSGLANSARMVAMHLSDVGINDEETLTEVIQVIDANSIDREVFRFRPDVVVIEAFWVTPDKLKVLRQLHPTVKWIIRGHSNIPFLALEGFAFGWIPEYVKIKNVYLATNSTESLRDLREVIVQRNGWTLEQAAEKVRLFSNYYYVEFPDSWVHDNFSLPLEVGCFGAIRPLKNQLLQAIAAMRFARELGRPLRFHMNVTRLENNSNQVYVALKHIFAGDTGAELVEHSWMPHSQFVPLVSTMHLTMQVSFSETFNIVTADAVSTGVPVVVSDDIHWIDNAFKADPTSSDDMVAKLRAAYESGRRGLHRVNTAGLTLFNEQASQHIQANIDFILQHTDLLGTTQ